VAKSIGAYFSEERNRRVLERLKEQIKIVPRPKSAHQPLSGITFVITGALASMTREQAEDAVRRLGGNAASSVSSKTGYLVVGTDPGSKLAKARDLGVKTISEDEFISMIGLSSG
jgi:DNA ligase (NAD+)